MKKYISIKNINYWCGVYGLRQSPDNVEFLVYNDEAKEDFFFQFDLYNLNAASEMARYNEEFSYHINASSKKMIDNKSPFEPMWQFYSQDILDLNLKINLKDERGSDPYYIGMCVNSVAPFLPYNLEEITKTIIEQCFGIKTEICFLDEIGYEMAKRAYLDDVNYMNPMFHENRKNF